MSGAHDFIARHRAFLYGASQLVLREVGRLSYITQDGYSCRASQTTIGDGCGYGREWVCRVIRRLLQTPIPGDDRMVLLKIGYTYRISGLDEHEAHPELCDHPQCIAEVRSLWTPRRRRPATRPRFAPPPPPATGDPMTPPTLVRAAQDASRGRRGILRAV